MIDENVDWLLVEKAQQGDENAVNELLKKYKNLVNKLSRSYFLIGGDIEDIVQEGMIGLYHAILHFSPDKKVTFKNFAGICIKHQIQNAIKVASSEKNKVLSSALSITDEVLSEEEEDKIELELPSDLPSPYDTILEKEKIVEMKSLVQKVLSPLERKILSLYLGGYNYSEIAAMANISKKSVDNGLSRIKNKLAFLKNER